MLMTRADDRFGDIAVPHQTFLRIDCQWLDCPEGMAICGLETEFSPRAPALRSDSILGLAAWS